MLNVCPTPLLLALEGLIDLRNIKKLIGRRIAKELKQQGISQEKLAELADMHRTFIGVLERGETNPTVETAYRISLALNVKLEVLLKRL